ncbi:MAG: hypothetical protein J0H64_04230 [Actinobacteria bacterium]|nr:hypothetical protein [Actinomycetota bacterium]
MAARQARPRYEGDPTLLRMMVQPRWIAALLLAIAVAAGFAWLGRWQLGNAILVEKDDSVISETARPIVDVTEPAAPVTDHAAGMVVTMRGVFVHGDFRVVDDRSNGGAQGSWVTGHFAVEGGGHLAVAVGWARTHAQAQAALERFDPALPTPGWGRPRELVGRYMPSDAAQLPQPGQDALQMTSMVPAQQINLWAPFEGPAYSGYLVMHPAGSGAEVLADSGLDAIDSVPPLPAEKVNWLNLFYAAEWVVFAGFAVFFWFRLVRDAWERAHELKLLEVADRSEDRPATDE